MSMKALKTATKCTNGISSCIGRTPLLKLNNKLYGVRDNINIFAKLEYFNPTGSIKDRMVQYVVEKLSDSGQITKNTTMIEASSGNTGAALALCSRNAGIKSVIVTDTKCSAEKQSIIRSFGAELLITESGMSVDSPKHYQNVVKNMYENGNKYFWFNQYDNTLNAEAFYETLAPEIYADMNGDIDYFICGSSTGGTLIGIGSYLKDKNDNIQVYLSDPIGSVLADYVKNDGEETVESESHLLEGVGKDSIPQVFNSNWRVIDDVIQINDTDAVKMCHFLTKNEGVFPGASGGLNILGALKLAKKIEREMKEENRDMNHTINIMTVVPDAGFKYLSKYYDSQWCMKNKVGMDQKIDIKRMVAKY